MNADDLAKILDELGKRLGPTGQHVFELAVRQVYINGVIAVGTFLTLVVLGIVVGPRLYRWTHNDNYLDDRKFLVVVISIAYFAVVLVAAYPAIVGLSSMLNPEYAAIRDLLGAIR